MVVPDLDIMVDDYLNKKLPSIESRGIDDPDLPCENYIDYFLRRVLYSDHFYLHNFNTLERCLDKTGFYKIRKCEPGDSILEMIKGELFQSEVIRHKSIIVEAQKSQSMPKVSRYKKEEPKNLLLKFLAKTCNIKLVPYIRRKPIFPTKLWLYEKKIKNHINLVDAQKYYQNEE